MTARKALVPIVMLSGLLSATARAGHMHPRSWQLTYWAPNQGPPPFPVRRLAGPPPAPVGGAVASPAPSYSSPLPVVAASGPPPPAGLTPAPPPAALVALATATVPLAPAQPDVALPSPGAAGPISAAPAPAAAPSPVAAFVNFGAGPYPEATLITTGGAQPWFASTQLNGLFGGPPTVAQQADFSHAVLARVEQTFSQSGVPLTLTSDPNTAAAHTLSLVSHTGSAAVGNAIGMTDVGANGFSFIDPIARASGSVEQLEWIVAHNIAHELMLAFGVPEIHDTTGNYLDAAAANWAMMINPAATFSPAAAQDLLARNLLSSSSAPFQTGAQGLDAQPVPEPATLALWLAALSVSIGLRRRFALWAFGIGQG